MYINRKKIFIFIYCFLTSINIYAAFTASAHNAHIRAWEKRDAKEALRQLEQIYPGPESEFSVYSPETENHLRFKNFYLAQELYFAYEKEESVFTLYRLSRKLLNFGKETIQKYPQSPQGYAALGEFYANLPAIAGGSVTDAEVCFKKMMQCKNITSFDFIRAVLFYLNVKKSYNESKRVITDARTRLKKDADLPFFTAYADKWITYNEGVLAFYRGNFNEAALVFARFTEDHPLEFWSWFMLGETLRKSGKPYSEIHTRAFTLAEKAGARASVKVMKAMAAM